MKIIGFLVLIVCGLVQMTAAGVGIQQLTDWPASVCMVLATFTGWTPILGTALGSYGAIVGWDWHWYSAAALFAWPLLLVPFFYLSSRKNRS